MHEELVLEGWSAIKAEVGCELRTFQDEEVLIAQGEKPPFLFHINEGEVVISLKDGGERAVRRMGPGSVICMVSAIKGQKCAFTARAVGKVVAESIPVGAFMYSVHEHPEHWHFVLRVLAEDSAAAKRIARSISLN